MTLITLMTLFSVSSFARQYIQCSEENGAFYSVVNLDGEKSTVYLTEDLGSDQPQSVLFPISAAGTTSDNVAIYKTPNSEVVVFVSSKDLNKASNDLTVRYLIGPTTYTASCFSSMY